MNLDETWVTIQTSVVESVKEYKLGQIKDIVDKYLNESGLNESAVTKSRK